MRRIGNRIQLALKKWKRVNQKLELFRFRQRWARKFGEFECVGGPLDDRMRKCQPPSIVPTEGRYYEFDPGDCRLHFRTGARVSSWTRQ